MIISSSKVSSASAVNAIEMIRIKSNVNKYFMLYPFQITKIEQLLQSQSSDSEDVNLSCHDLVQPFFFKTNISSQVWKVFLSLKW